MKTKKEGWYPKGSQEAKAAKKWLDQVYRCTEPSFGSYKYYGAKGIRVEYTQKEFVAWWMTQSIELRKTPRVAVGRIDHNKNYSLDNIELVTAGANSKEMVSRTGDNRVGTPVVLVGDDGTTTAFCSVPKAARHFGMSRSSLECRLSRKHKRRKGHHNEKFRGEIYTLDDFMRLDGSI